MQVSVFCGMDWSIPVFETLFLLLSSVLFVSNFILNEYNLLLYYGQH